MDTLTPKDHAEAIALYRSEIVGSLTHRQLDRGDVQAALVELSKQRFCAPRSHGARTYSVPTLERWYYAFKSGGVAGLRPHASADKGRAREPAPEIRTLIADIRRERPTTSVPLILAALEAEGRLERNAVSASTVRRFLAEAGLDRVAAQHGRERDKIRLRWEASGPGALWHSDVCHARGMHVAGRVEPVRIQLRTPPQRAGAAAPDAVRTCTQQIKPHARTHARSTQASTGVRFTVATATWRQWASRRPDSPRRNRFVFAASRNAHSHSAEVECSVWRRGQTAFVTPVFCRCLRRGTR